MKKITAFVLSALLCMCAVFPGIAFADAASSGAYNYQDADYYVVVDAWDGYVNFRYGPGLEYGIISPIYNGTYLHVTTTANNYYDEFTWASVEWNGSWGWVSLHECSYTDNPYPQPETTTQAYYEPVTAAAPQEAPQPAANTDNNKIELNVEMLKNGEWQSSFDTILSMLNDALKKSYAPYNEYYTSAVLVDVDGNAFTGVYVENSNPELSICAEAAAIAKAVSEGSRNYRLIAVIGAAEGNAGTDYYTPCRDCQDIMREFVNSGDFYVLTIQLNGDGTIAQYQVRTLGKLMSGN